MKSKPDRKPFLAVALALALGLGGCSTFEGTPIVPTGSVRSPETSQPASYPPVGVTPPAPAPALSTDERDRIRTELNAARESNRAAAQAPLDQPLPPPTTGQANQPSQPNRSNQQNRPRRQGQGENREAQQR